MEWVNKLSEMRPRTLEICRIRNEYAQYLRIMMDSNPVHLLRPFKEPPPTGAITPLPELLGNLIMEACPELPRTGIYL